MSGPVRRLAQLVGNALEHVYPRRQAAWARAMRCEIDAVERDGAALRFALGCLCGGCRQARAELLSSIAEGPAMTNEPRMRPDGRNIGIVCALAATCLGIAYLAAAGAPPKYIVVNAAAFLLGIVALGAIRVSQLQPGRFTGGAMIVLAACLLATALFGSPVDGASRWIWLGPLGVQLSLVFLPPMIVLFARRPDVLSSLAIAAAAVALALQPDRAMAAVLAFATAVLAAARPGRYAIAAFAVAVTAGVVTLMRPEGLPAVPYVDQVLFTAFDVHLLAGAAVVLGALLLLVPALAGWRADPARRHVYLAFGAAWLGCVLAAALGNYPTPVVGYGGSAILGYLLSLSFLPSETVKAPSSATAAPHEGPDEDAGILRSAMA